MLDSTQRPANKPGIRTFVRVAVGLLLLGTAGLKLYGLNISAIPRVGWLALPGVQLAVAEWEIVLGVWLLSGRFRLGSWVAAMGMFGVFAIVSGYLGLKGVANCGCFGSINASPYYVFGADLLIIVILLTIRPTFDSIRSSNASQRRRGLVAAARWTFGTTTAGAILLSAASLYFGSLEAAFARFSGTPVTLKPQFVDFGAASVGQIREATVNVTNWNDHPIRIVGGTADCSCITTVGLPIEIAPGGTETVPLRLVVPNSTPGVFTRTAEMRLAGGRQQVIVFHLGCRIE